MSTLSLARRATMPRLTPLSAPVVLVILVILVVLVATTTTVTPVPAATAAPPPAATPPAGNVFKTVLDRDVPPAAGQAADGPSAMTNPTSTHLDIADFRAIGVTMHTASATPGRVRVHTGTGWGNWADLGFMDSGPDPTAAEGRRAMAAGDARASEPVWVGHADGYEVETPTDATDVVVELSREHEAPAAAGSSAPEADTSTITPSQGQPTINLRSAWGARAPKVQPDIAPAVRYAIVHHSVSSNDYAPGDVPGMLRAVQAFHMDGRGWDDIGYNFAIDKFGGIWEARAGGMDRAIIGAHAFAQNYESAGIVALGDYSLAAPTQAMLDAYSRLIGWKLWISGWDVNNQAEGHSSVVGHRDVNQTECPGTYLWNQLGTIRAGAAEKQAQLRSMPGFWSGISVTKNTDGRLEAFAVTNGNELWHNWQVPGSSSGWSGWAPLITGATGRPALATNDDLRLEAFVVNTSGRLMHVWQDPTSGSGWSQPAALPGTWSPSAGVGVASNPDGRLDVFALSDPDYLAHIWQVRGSATGWADWANLAFGFPSNAGILATNNKDGRIEVFATNDDRKIGHAWQSSAANGGWSDFAPLDMVVTGGAAVALNGDGRLEVLGVDDVGQMRHVWQEPGATGWSNAAALPGSYNPGSAVDLVLDPSTKLNVFGTSGNNLVTIKQNSAAASGWASSVNITGAPVLGAMDAIRQNDNLLAIVAIAGPSGTSTVAATQTVPSGPWGTLHTIG